MDPSVGSDASKSYSKRANALFSDLAPSTPLDCRGRVPGLPSPSAVSIMSGESSVRCLPIGLPSLPSAPCILVARAVGEFSSLPPCPRPSSPGLSSASVVPPGVSSPLGSLATPGVSAP